MSAIDRAADIQRELAVLVVRHDEVRRRLDSLVAAVHEQDARLARLRARIVEQRAHTGDEVRPDDAPSATPGRPTEPADRPEQEGDVFRPSDVRALRPGPVTAGLLGLLARSDPER